MKHSGIFIILILFSIYCQAQQDPVTRQQHFNLQNQIALDKYDAVSYHSGKPLKGTSNWASTYLGITYYFSSQPNLILFKTNPAKYEPAYGGWCAYAMGSDGSKVEVDPETFKIIDGKLYLFYNFYFNNTLKKWNDDQTSLKPRADKNWNSLYSK